MPKSCQKLRIAVIDDHPMMRQGIITVLQSSGTFDVVGEGQSADEAVAIAREREPDVMLLDLNMPGNGLDAVRRIAEHHPMISTVVLTVREDQSSVSEALRSGARGYLLKGISGPELIRTIIQINDGDIAITPSLAVQLLAPNADKTSSADLRELQLESLTSREMEILKFLAQGQPNKKIGAELGLSEKTIKHYITNILQKLHVRNRVEAALVAQKILNP